MESKQIVLARKVIKSLKNHWARTNPHVRIIMRHFKEKYGELPRPDHLAIRSISGIGFGIEEANCLFSALGYKFGAFWPIPALNIEACHFEPLTQDLEKIFFSEIDLDTIKKSAPQEDGFSNVKKEIMRSICNISNDVYYLCGEIYSGLCGSGSLPKNLIYDLTNFFVVTTPSWDIHCEYFNVIARESYLQETAHVLAYGFIPNHFSFLIQDPTYKFPGYTTMENLRKEIESLGIPMQKIVEGEETSMLCQVSTKAYLGKFLTFDSQSKPKKIKWPRSYIEFIKRGADPTSPTGRYEGFLPNQAKALFKMTAKK